MMGMPQSHVPLANALSLTVLTILLVECHGQGIQTPVNTTSGEVTGKSVNFRGKTLWEFKMVPYAEPPAGNLRFKPPKPKIRETSVIDGTREEYSICPQTAEFGTQLEKVLIELVNQTYTVTEDCLYLNAYVPQSASLSNPLPVLVWIHGGRFSGGAARFYSGRVLAADFDVVVVTINYRVGALGFLNTADDNALGDFGLRDQILAIQWVKNNIRSFGGDPDLITIAGHAAGGASVAQLIISPLTEGLFQRAILQSGGLDKPNACLPDPKKSAVSFAQTLGCNTETSQSLVQCLRTKTWEEIVEKQGLFAPACSGGVVPFTQDQLETSEINSEAGKRLAKLNIMVGVTSQEAGLMFTALSAGKTDADGGVPENFTNGFINNLLRGQIGVSENYSSSLKPTIKFLYTNWKMPENFVARSKKVIDLMGDYFYVVSAIKTIRLHSNIPIEANGRGHSYFYLMKPRPSWMAQQQWRSGADHGDDLFFLFGNPVEYSSLNASPEEKVLSQTIMSYWTNFIKTGNPNTPLTTVNSSPLVTWPQFDLDNQQYLQLDTTMDNNSVDHRLFADRMVFWTEYFPAELRRLQAIKPLPPCKIVSSGCSVGPATALTFLISLLTLYWQHENWRDGN